MRPALTRNLAKPVRRNNPMPLIRRLHFKRYNQIICVLVRNGFGLFLEQMGILGYLRIRRKKMDPDSARAAENARKSIGEAAWRTSSRTDLAFSNSPSGT